MKLTKSALLIFCGVLYCAQAYGYKPTFQTLEAEHGLSMNTVNDLVTDERGFLWIATQAGLNRYDGQSFRVYSSHDSPKSPSANDITALYVSAKGELWLLTENAGLNRYHYDSDDFSIFGAEAGIPDVSFSGIAEDAEGNLWLATSKSGVLVFSPSTGKVIRTLDSLSTPALIDQHISALVSDKLGGFWLNTPTGISHISHDGKLSKPEPLNGIDATKIKATTPGYLWLGTPDRGLFRYDSETQTLQSYQQYFPTGMLTDTITDIVQDSAGTLWIATAGSGLAQLDPNQNTVKIHGHSPSDHLSLSSQNLTRLWPDLNGLLWIGTRNAGVSRLMLSASSFGHVDGQTFSDNNLQNIDIRSIFRDSQNQLWIGSTGGLVRAVEKDGQLTGFKPHGLPFSGLDQGFISFIDEDDDGNLWIGTRGLGLVIANAQRSSVEHFQSDPDDSTGLPSNTLYSLFRDSDKNYWVTTLDSGISRINRATGTFESIDRYGSKQLPEDQVTGMAEDSQGNLWISTYGGGLARLDKQGSARHFNINSSPALPSNHLFSIHFDTNNNLWVASDNGVFSINTQTLALQHYSQENGLIGNVAYLSVLDKQHRLWVGTSTGLSIIDTRDGSLRSFTKEDGLQDNEFNFGAGFIDKDGSVYLGGINGFNHVNPNELPQRRAPFPPLITHFLLLNQSTPMEPLTHIENGSPMLQLNHKQTLFSFGYQSPALADSKQLVYQYRMQGLDNNWIRDFKGQLASFTGLSPGRYRFEIKSTNIDGQHSPITALDIEIAPAPWQTWWAYSLYALSLLSVLGVFVYMSLSKYHSKMAMLSKIAVSEQRLQQALWSSGDEFWDWEIDQKRLTRSNSFMLYPEHESDLEDTLKSVIHPDDLQLTKESIDNCLYRGEDEFEISYRGRVKDDKWLWVLNHGKVISRDEQGRPNRIMGTIKNIQRLKEAEEALRSFNAELEHRVAERTRELSQKNDELKETLEELSQARDELIDKEKMATLGGLVASITHEVNTPIGISVTAASHLEDRVREFTAAFENGEADETDFIQYQQEINDCCKLIRTNLERASKLISSFKKVSVDQSHEELREFDLSQYVDEIFVSLNPLLSRSGHHYSYECQPNLYINSNPGIFYQIISNLFNNSIIHAFPQGKSGNLTLTIKRSETGITIDYRDDGCGMSEDVKNRIFTPFFTTKRGKGGSGLGMNIVYNLVHQVLEGKISLQTAPGEGAHFTIELPCQILAPSSDGICI
ncbi:two-component regulator propeller domain-containing protein [Shewanella sp.]|uniref:two-component regulator propeller domain-containing protein n=1 Tax=Shewanella sp. TaxID=50422 RepID=UPI0035691DFE